MSDYVIGLDFGTDSVRAMVVNAHTGEAISIAVEDYPRWAKKLYCDPSLSLYRQHPRDFIESMEKSLYKVLAPCQAILKDIRGISIATTGSTPVAVDSDGTPLAFLPEFESNPNAMFILWKDHTANAEANEINAAAKAWEVDYTKYSGGVYSPEWFWSKLLHVLRTDHEVAAKAFSWVEHCDWMPGVLAGNTAPLELKRSRCAAGHKAMWHEEFNGLPAAEFLEKLDPLLKGVREKLYRSTYTADQAVGLISSEWSTKLGLRSDVKIGVGAIDAHFGAVGAAIEPGTMVKVMGTSTCDMLIAPLDVYQHQLIAGICGQVDGSIIPGMMGMEAGQSAFGDVYKWFEQILSFVITSGFSGIVTEDQCKNIQALILPELNNQAALLPLTVDDEVALDWINGRRTPDADLNLKGVISGITLGTTAPRIFKTLVEATAFGAKAIIMRFKDEGVPVNKVIVLGGISKKSTFVLQTLANIIAMPIAVVKSEHTCALGAAMFAATICNLYPNIQSAQKSMSSGFDIVFNPEPEKVSIYKLLYKKYIELGKIY